jgi:hypothetical protein
MQDPSLSASQEAKKYERHPFAATRQMGENEQEGTSKGVVVIGR